MPTLRQNKRFHQPLGKRMSLYIGLMSGTSLDGVDGALADFTSGAITTLAAAYIPFPATLRAELMALQASGPNEIEREALAANQLAAFYAQCVAALLAELCGIDVIADFRSRDIAAGGQGAPLVPAFHHALFGQAGQTRVVANIGGIANISVLGADGAVIGFDTGPGNVLMDAWIARQQGKEYDEDGAWAAAGREIPALLNALLTEPYFAQPAPKSTGRDLFHEQWLDAKLAPHIHDAPADIQFTLTKLTALTLADAIHAHAPQADAVYICGGGAYNGTLL